MATQIDESSHLKLQVETNAAKCDELLKGDLLVPDKAMLQRCRESLHNLSKSCPEPSSACSETSCKTWLTNFTKTILDLTYIEENCMVASEFPQYENKVILLSNLNVPLELLHLLSTTSLDPDIVECIHWRRGALCYMYCATIAPEQQRLDKEKAHFLQSGKNCVSYLQDMLAVRGSLQDDRDNVTTNCEDVFALLKDGIYSDTHMLAHMYMGEVCYWLCEHGKCEMDQAETDNYRELGRTFLSLFIKVVQGPMAGQGWTCDKAKELVEKLT